MTVHAFRCHIGRGPMSPSDLETRITEWVDKNGEWEDGGITHGLVEWTTEAGETYHTIGVRFLPDNSKDNLLQKLTDKLENKVAWYRVGYHACTHREGDESSGPCDWNDKTEWTAKDVTIPSGVPTFSVP